MYLFLCFNFIIPFTMLLIGAILKRCPNHNMNFHSGYRSPVSMRSQAHWDYAQRIAPDIFFSLGKKLAVLELLLSGAAFLLRIWVIPPLMIGLCTGIGVMLYAFYRTDAAVREFMGD